MKRVPPELVTEMLRAEVEACALAVEAVVADTRKQREKLEEAAAAVRARKVPPGGLKLTREQVQALVDSLPW